MYMNFKQTHSHIHKANNVFVDRTFTFMVVTALCIFGINKRALNSYHGWTSTNSVFIKRNPGKKKQNNRLEEASMLNRTTVTSKPKVKWTSTLPSRAGEPSDMSGDNADVLPLQSYLSDCWSVELLISPHSFFSFNHIFSKSKSKSQKAEDWLKVCVYLLCCRWGACH